MSAVSIGKKRDRWPGSRLVEIRSRDFCSDWVGAWTNYSLDYEYAYTWFGKDDWASGNRMSVCWAAPRSDMQARRPLTTMAASVLLAAGLAACGTGDDSAGKPAVEPISDSPPASRTSSRCADDPATATR